MCRARFVGLESGFTKGIAPTAPVLTEPGMTANAGLSFEALSAKRQAAVCLGGLLDFAGDMFAIHS
jgi:hypothetical protein